MKKTHVLLTTVLFALVTSLVSCKQEGDTIYIFRNTFTVNFYANGGTGKMEAQTFIQDTEQALSKNGFTAPSGRVFAGLTTDEDSRVKVYDDNQYIKIKKNLSLYALWKMDEGSGTATEAKKWPFAAYKDTTKRPGDGFYQYVGGKWLENPNDPAVSLWKKQGHESDDDGAFSNQDKFCNEFKESMFNPESEIFKKATKTKVFKKAVELLPITDEKKNAEIEVLKKLLEKIDNINTVEDFIKVYTEHFLYDEPFFSIQSGQVLRSQCGNIC